MGGLMRKVERQGARDKAKAAARRWRRERKFEAALAAKASRLTPEQARRALAEWAARGGK